MTLILAIIASAAGWAIFALSVAVLDAMDPRRTGRWLSAAGWCGCLFAGLALGLDPKGHDWQLIVLATSMALIGWRNVHALRVQAAEPSPFRRAVPVVAVAVLAGCVAIAPALGAWQ